MRKSKNNTPSGFSIVKIQIFIFFITAFAFADEFYDDLPPEFGLDDDPEPGASIDFFIPVSMILMLIGLIFYFYKHRERIESSEIDSNL